MTVLTIFSSLVTFLLLKIKISEFFFFFFFFSFFSGRFETIKKKLKDIGGPTLCCSLRLHQFFSAFSRFSRFTHTKMEHLDQLKFLKLQLKKKEK